MQTTTIEKTTIQNPNRIKEKEAFIDKLEEAIKTNCRLSKVIRAPEKLRAMPLFNPRTHTIKYIPQTVPEEMDDDCSDEENNEDSGVPVFIDGLGTRIGPTPLLDRLVKQMDDNYKRSINKVVLKDMLKEARQDLNKLKRTSRSKRDVQTLTIIYRNGIIKPNVYPEARKKQFHWQIKSSGHPFERVGRQGQEVVVPDASSGALRLHYNDGTVEIISNQIDIGSCVKRQSAAAKRKQWILDTNSKEYAARCKGVAGRILRLTQPRGPREPGPLATRFSMRIFQDRVSRLPQHLDIKSSVEIIDLCKHHLSRSKPSMNAQYIKMVEFCEPTIRLDGAGRRRALQKIATGSEIKCLLQLPGDDSDSDPDEYDDTSESSSSESSALSSEDDSGSTLDNLNMAELRAKRDELGLTSADLKLLVSGSNLAKKADLAASIQIYLDNPNMLAERKEEARDDTSSRGSLSDESSVTSESEESEDDSGSTLDKLNMAELRAKRDELGLTNADLKLLLPGSNLSTKADLADSIQIHLDNPNMLAERKEEARGSLSDEGSVTTEDEEDEESEDEDGIIPGQIIVSSASEGESGLEDERETQLERRQAHSDNSDPDSDNSDPDSDDSNSDNSDPDSDDSAESADPDSDDEDLHSDDLNISGFSEWSASDMKGRIAKAVKGETRQNGGLNVSDIKAFLREYGDESVRELLKDHEKKFKGTNNMQTWIREFLGIFTKNATYNEDELFSDSGADSAAIDILSNNLATPGELTRMLSNMSDDWASSEDELNFASNGSELEFAESSATEMKTSDGLEFAESSAVETDSGGEMSDGLGFAESSDVKTSSGLEFAESSAVETDSGKEMSPGLDFAESSDYD